MKNKFESTGINGYRTDAKLSPSPNQLMLSCINSGELERAGNKDGGEALAMSTAANGGSSRPGGFAAAVAAEVEVGLQQPR